MSLSLERQCALLKENQLTQQYLHRTVSYIDLLDHLYHLSYSSVVPLLAIDNCLVLCADQQIFKDVS